MVLGGGVLEREVPLAAHPGLMTLQHRYPASRTPGGHICSATLKPDRPDGVACESEYAPRRGSHLFIPRILTVVYHTNSFPVKMTSESCFSDCLSPPGFEVGVGFMWV